MIDGSIRAQAEAFKAAARDRLSAYPALVPDSDWPSMSILDDLSYHLSYRSDWTDQEERLFQGVISLLAQFVHESWSTFHDDVAVTRTARGIECVAIELAKAEGRDIDWLNTFDARRFLFEKRLYAIPLVYLSCETASARRYRGLVRALADMDVEGALEAVARHVADGPELLFQEAMLFKVQQQRREAQELFDQIEREYPRFANGEFLNEYGMNCLAMGLSGRAVALLERAVEAGGTFGRAQSNLGWALLSAGHLERSIEVLDEAIGHTDLIVTALLNRAYARREVGDEEGAEADVAMATRLYPFDRRVVSWVMAGYYGN